MKDTAITYDLAHQQHSWNQQRQQQQQQSHNNNVYANHSMQHASNNSQTQRSNVNHSPQGQPSTTVQMNQYHNQHLQSNAHHNSGHHNSAYYQQAHLYSNYQTHLQDQPSQNQQHSDHHHQHHPSGTTTMPSATAGSSSIVDAAVVAAVHHQATSNTQNHAGWPSPGVGSMQPQAHHPVVTDQSTLAYMSHAYQNHNSTVNDHHRNSNGPLTSQQLNAGHNQTSSYAVDTLYNTPAAAAASLAAYGYNNLNAAFFQTSNNVPHTQTGHPTQANLSTFWSHNQTTQQQRSAHSQTVTNPSSVQPRQAIGSDQAANYLHDPHLYYGRPAYGQGLQNFGQTQHHAQTTQQQTDVLHHRLAAFSQQHQLLPHHDQQLHQAAQHHQQSHHQSPLSGHHHSPSNQVQPSVVGQQHHQQQLTIQQSSQTAANTATCTTQSPGNKQISTVKTSPQHHTQRSSDLENDETSKINRAIKSPLDSLAVQNSLSKQPAHSLQSTKEIAPPSTQCSQDLNSAAKDQVQFQQPSHGSKSPNSKSNSNQPVMKSDSSSQYQRKPLNSSISLIQNRDAYRAPAEERSKPQLIEAPKKSSTECDARPISKTDSQTQPSSKPPESDQPAANIEESMSSLTIGTTRKTTWASIASQPAKISQPKSLKSKIAGSNSVLPSAKHLAAVSLDTSNLESKNGINPAIKNSVSSAVTSIQRSSVPPPISKLAAVAASIKLNTLGEDNIEHGKISWPAMNASINRVPIDPPLKESNMLANDQTKTEDGHRSREMREPVARDHNHNQGSNLKIINSYQSNHTGTNREPWTRREQRDPREMRDFRDSRDPRDIRDSRGMRESRESREQRHPRDQRDHRVRSDSDRKDSDGERSQHDEHKSMNVSRRDYKPNGPRGNQFRADTGEDQYIDGDQARRGFQLNQSERDRANENIHNARLPFNRLDPRDNFHHHQAGNEGRHYESRQSAPLSDSRDGGKNSSNNVSGSNLNRGSKTDLNPANFNPKIFDLEPRDARYFIIKSYSEDDVHRSIKYSIWCSTNHGNKRLDEAYRQQQAKNGPVYLFFSVNGSGHFCGMAQMMSSVDFDSSSGVWAQSKWQGEFSVKWIYVKDVPNNALRHITLENNEDKPVTNSRDTQEVPSEKGKAVLKILHQYSHTTSLFDDFMHYERRQEEGKVKKPYDDRPIPPGRGHERDRGGNARFGRSFTNSRSHNDFRGNRDRAFRPGPGPGNGPMRVGFDISHNSRINQ